MSMVKQDGEKDRSLFVVATFHEGPCRGMLYEFKIKQQGGKVIGGVVVEEDNEPSPVPLLYPLTKFFEQEQVGPDDPLLAFLECARFCGSSKLYLLLGAGVKHIFPLTYSTVDHPLDGLVFDTNTMSSSSFRRPIEYYLRGPIISAYGKLYYLADPTSFPLVPKTSFERYDPVKDSWERLPPCPFYSPDWQSFDTIGYAVSCGCILFSVGLGFSSKYHLMLFHISRNQWHRVKTCVSDDSDYIHFPFHGRAVVIDDTTIYVASNFHATAILVLSLRMERSRNDNGYISYSYFLDTKFVLSGLEIVPPPSPFEGLETHFLVHLGDLEFCIVQTGVNYQSTYRQHLCITTFRIVIEECNSLVIEMLDSTVRDLYLPDTEMARILFSFTPDYDDTETKEMRSVNTVKPAKQESERASYVMKDGSSSTDERRGKEISLAEDKQLKEEMIRGIAACQTSKKKATMKEEA